MMILFYALYLLQIGGPGITQPGQQHMSLQLQQRRENHLDDRQKTSVGLSTDMKPPLASIGQSPVIAPTDAPSANKVLYFHTSIMFFEHDVIGVMSPISISVFWYYYL
jgi:hypothetical protein